MRRLQRGGALLITIGVLASLVAILVSAAATQKVGQQAISNRMSARRARLAAESGVQRALASLVNQSLTATSQEDEWYTLGQVGAENFVVGAGSFRIQVVDGSGLVNLNTAPEAALSRLPLTQEQIDSLLDWREAGTTPRQDGGKDEYYNQLTVPYNAKLRGLNSFDELLLIKGFTPSALFEPQTNAVNAQPLPQRPDGTEQTLYDLCTVDSVSGNTDASGQQKPNITSVTNPQALLRFGLTLQQAQAIIAAQPTSYAALLARIPNPQAQRQIVDTYSVSNAATLTGKIDVNTATDAVLETIPNMTPDVASAIVSRQSTPFTQLGDLFDVPGFSGAIAQQTMDYLTTNSQTFVIRSMGKAGDSTVALEAVVSLSANGVQIQKVTQLPYADMSARWGWQTDTTSETVLKEATQS